MLGIGLSVSLPHPPHRRKAGGRGFLSALILSALLSGSGLRAADGSQLLSFTNAWRYLQDANPDGVFWQGRDYDDSAWPSGAGVFARETCRCLPQPVNTVLDLRTNGDTCYFRTHFTNDSDWPVRQLVFSNLIDDGAVFYLNGGEIQRVRMPAGTVTNATRAGRKVGETKTGGGFTVYEAALTNLVRGDNVLAVELHQAATGASNVVFGSAVRRLLGPRPALLSPAADAGNVPLPPMLTVTVADPDTTNLTVNFHGRVTATNTAPDFTVVVLPDTQKYSKTHSNILVGQIEWILANRVARNIVYVAHLGDITDSGDEQLYEWLNATNALHRLEDPTRTGLPHGIPYGVVPGNHDHRAGTNFHNLYNAFFGVAHFTGRPWYGGHFGSDNQSHYDLFSAAGMDFVVLYTDYWGTKLDYGPIDAWANRVLAANPNRRAIAVTHGILETDGSYDISRSPTLYDSLKGNANLFLMLCGHNHGEAHRQDTFDGRTVHICLSDYQSYTNGGSGFLRLYEFSPANSVIRVKTYSPHTGQYETDAQSQFEIPYDMNAPWQAIATNVNVASGATASAAWPDCPPGTRLEWRVTVSDGAMTTQSPIRSFLTAPAGGGTRARPSVR